MTSAQQLGLLLTGLGLLRFPPGVAVLLSLSGVLLSILELRQAIKNPP
jgi:hypothetical protein